MTASNENFIRPNGSYDVSAALDHATLLQRRSQYVTTRRGSRAIVQASRRLWIFASQMVAPIETLKTRIR